MHRPLSDYSWFVSRIRENKKEYDSLEDAIDAALKDLADDSPIKPFLIKNKSEVTGMCITEYDEARTLAEQREEGREEGRKEGRKEERRALLAKLRSLGVDEEILSRASGD